MSFGTKDGQEESTWFRKMNCGSFNRSKLEQSLGGRLHLPHQKGELQVSLGLSITLHLMLEPSITSVFPFEATSAKNI